MTQYYPLSRKVFHVAEALRDKSERQATQIGKRILTISICY